MCVYDKKEKKSNRIDTVRRKKENNIAIIKTAPCLSETQKKEKPGLNPLK